MVNVFRGAVAPGLIVAGAIALTTGAASAQGMFPAIPDQFAAKLVAEENAPLAKLTPVTDAMLRDPPSGDWLMWRRTYDGWGFSPLDQVNKANVKDLRLVWSWSMTNGATEITPIVHDGVLFIQNYGDSVDALDGANGNLLWRYNRPKPPEGLSALKRMMAIHDDKILVATSGKHLVALDMHTGVPEWDVPVAGDGSFTSGPMALNGKAIIGASGCTTSRCSITAHDLKDGKELWRFYTVAAPGDPGGDTWNGLPVDQRFGGSSWTSGSYDPGRNLLYWGVGQPYPWNAFARGTSPTKPGLSSETLYTNNTLALDPDTGKLAWHFSPCPTIAGTWTMCSSGS